jgi:ribose transport system substrate-binding protein
MLKRFLSAALFSVLALGSAASSYAAPLKGAMVVMDLTTNAFQITMANLAVKLGKEAGAEVTRYAPEGSFGDYAGQIAIIENLITKKVDFIILVAGHPKALVPVVSKAMKAGIAVVNIDNRLDTTDVVSFVGVDNGAGGKMAVDYIASRLGGQGKIALLQGETGNPVQILRTMGFELGAAVHPGLKVVAKQGAHWTEDEGLQVMTNVLQANPDVDGVFGESDNLAVGAARAVASAKTGKKVIIVGYDGQDAGYKGIKDGSLAATIRMDAEKMVGTGIKHAIQYIKQGGKRDGIPPETYIAPELVDASNVAKYMK